MARTLLRQKPGLHLLTRLLNPPIPYYRSLETLAYEEVRSASPTEEGREVEPTKLTAFVLHGLLGSGRNWRSFSRSLASSLSSSSSPPSDWKMVLVDLRNHGQSAEIDSLHPPHDLVNAANDLTNLVTSQAWAWPDIVIGHSMGGKVALQYALSCARGDYGDSAKLPKQNFLNRLRVNDSLLTNEKPVAEQLWVLDSVPGKVNRDNSDGEVEKVLQTLQSLPSSIPSRKWLIDYMLKLGFSKSLSEWIGSNLKKSGEHETWAFNLEGAVQMFNSYRELDYWPLLEQPPKGMEIVIVRAENSDRWDPEVVQELERLAHRKVNGAEGKVTVHVLPKSGHWVHVDNPKGLLDIVTPKIASLV